MTVRRPVHTVTASSMHRLMLTVPLALGLILKAELITAVSYVSGFTQARYYQSAVVYNGFLYMMGGRSSSSANDCTAASDDCSGVQYAPINANGTVGTWAYTEGGVNNGSTYVSGFTQARTFFSSVIYNGYLYIMGGGAVARAMTVRRPVHTVTASSMRRLTLTVPLVLGAIQPALLRLDKGNQLLRIMAIYIF